VERGASREEVAETLGMAIYMGAGPSVMYASHALEAFNQFANRAANSEASREHAGLSVAAEWRHGQRS